MKQENKQTGITVFYSYASADRKYRNQLSAHLSQLKHDGLIEEWYEQQILAGSDRLQAIDQAIRSADIIILLISADFLASDSCYHSEMQQALERHRRGEAHVIPVIVRSCDWRHSSFASLQSLPRNSKPITTWENQDEAWLSIAQELRKIIAPQQFPSPPLSSLQWQNRASLLKRVRTNWIKGLLEDSLHQAAWIDLHLQEQPDALENPWRLQVQELDHTPHPLPVGTSIVEVYDEADGELLILGEPGSGKTTLLLQLARTLLDRAEADERQRMPIVFNLSSWAQKKETLATWLVEELKTKYQVSRQVGQHWVEANQVLPLLDGLDEVAEEARAACVQAITAYYSHHQSQIGTPLVVCCRSQEYQELSLHLPLSRAVSILPLTEGQIDDYLSRAQGQLEGFRQALHDDTELSTLAHRPLMLSIFTLAYQGTPLNEIIPLDTLPAKQRQVFVTYMQRMLTRRSAHTRYTSKQTIHWLIYLARQMKQQNQTIFYIEHMQPDWLPGGRAHRLYRSIVGGLLIGLVGGLPLGFLGTLINEFVNKPPVEFLNVLVLEVARLLHAGLLGAMSSFVISLLIVGLLSGLTTVLVVGLPSGLLIGLLNMKDTEILPAEDVVWSWAGMRRGFVEAVVIGLLSSVLGMIVIQLSDRLLVALPLLWLVGGLVGGLVMLLSQGFSRRTRNEHPLLMSRRVTWRALRGGILTGLLILPVGVLVGAMIAVLILMLNYSQFLVGSNPWIMAQNIFVQLTKRVDALVLALFITLIIGLIGGVVIGTVRGLLKGVLREKLAENKRIVPNQGIHRSLWNSLRVGLSIGLFFGLMGGFAFAAASAIIFAFAAAPDPIFEAFFIGLFSGVFIGLLFGLVFGLLNGGTACIKHVILRLLLWRTQCTPWSYIRFLDYAAERILLRKIGGSYIFVHRLLLEYFATLDESAFAESTSLEGKG